VFVGEKWDFTPENVRVTKGGVLHCAECGESKPLSEAARDSKKWCQRCEYISQILKRAKFRAGEGNVPFTLTSEHFRDTKVCQILGLPLGFNSGSGPGLFKATLDRLVPGGGYTKENTVLRCAGVNFLKGDMSEDGLLEFLQKVGHGKRVSMAT
jgi:hypothetical protein